jgi:hypothetical protein
MFRLSAVSKKYHALSMTPPLLEFRQENTARDFDGSLSLLSQLQYSHPNLLKKPRVPADGAVVVPKKKNKDNFKYELGPPEPSNKIAETRMS